MLCIYLRFEPLVAKDYCRFKPVGIQAYGVKWDYSEVSLEPIGNVDASTEDTNSSDVKAPEVKKENETFKISKISTWLNMSSNDNKSNSNQFDNSMCPSSKSGTPNEGILFVYLKHISVTYNCNLLHLYVTCS